MTSVSFGFRGLFITYLNRRKTSPVVPGWPTQYPHLAMPLIYPRIHFDPLSTFAKLPFVVIIISLFVAVTESTIQNCCLIRLAR